MNAEFEISERTGVAIATDVAIPMRDGIRLMADVYFSSAGTGPPHIDPGPVVLTRSLTSRSAGERRRQAEKLAAQGLVVVVQDCRGSGSSEGDAALEHQELPDGHDTIAWLVKQPWCNGTVGLYGHGYGGYAALAAPAFPEVKALAVSQPYEASSLRSSTSGGCLQLSKLASIVVACGPRAPRVFEHGENRGDPTAIAIAGLEALFANFTLESASKTVADYPAVDAWWQRQIADAPVEIERWSGSTLVSAALHLSSGWFDPQAPVVAALYAAARERGSPANIVFGPWRHAPDAEGERTVGEVDFGASAALSPSHSNTWLPKVLAGHDGGFTQDDAATADVFVMGGGDGSVKDGKLSHGGAWRRFASWPPPTRSRAFRLGPGEKLGGGTGLDGTVSYTSDPHDPVPTVAGAIHGLGVLAPVSADTPSALRTFLKTNEVLSWAGPRDQVITESTYGASPPFLPLAARGDVAVFQTEPLSDSLEIVGQVESSLWLSCDGPDADVAVKLIDLYPPSPTYPRGFAFPLCDGIRRLRFKPGEVQEVRVVVGLTANRFERGHRVRVDVCGSNFPRYDVNPSTMPASVTVHLGGKTPSTIWLPVLHEVGA